MYQTAPWIAYRAWQNTSRPILYETSDAKGNKTTVEISLLNPEDHPHYGPNVSGTCAVCGATFTGGVPTEKMFGDSYTDWGRHKHPESAHICGACAWAMMLNVKCSRQGLLRYAYTASEADGIHICNRLQIRDALLDPPAPPFVAIVPVSQKKHLTSKASVSHDRERYYCMLEEECIEVKRAELERQVLLVESLRGMGCTKDEIEKATIRYDRAKEIGFETLEKVIDRLTQMRKSRMFTLALHIARKPEDKEACKCYLDSLPNP